MFEGTYNLGTDCDLIVIQGENGTIILSPPELSEIKKVERKTKHEKKAKSEKKKKMRKKTRKKSKKKTGSKGKKKSK